MSGGYELNVRKAKSILQTVVQTQIALRLAEIVHRLTFKWRYRPMAEAMERYRKCYSKKPRPQIEKEMTLCKQFWGCYPLHYYRYDLYRRDKQLSETELLNYIPEFFFYYLFLPYYDSAKYAALVGDKNIAELLFRGLGIHQAHTICKLINQHIYTNRLLETDFNAIEQELAEKKYKRIFVKPLYGKGGHGIYVFGRNNDGQYNTRNNNVFDEIFLDEIGRRNDYIIQAGIEQDIEMARIYPDSVNTFRIITENKNSYVRILYPVFFRVGRNGNQVDNYDKNGLLTTIEVDTGKMGDYASSMHGEQFEKHPDTKFCFRGHRISRWKKVREFVAECAKKMPHFTYLGWDIALTSNGPLVVETNLGTGLDGLQIHSGGLREMFKIDDPRFYWRNKGKRAC